MKQFFVIAEIACMRKLLVILNTMVRNQTPWKTNATLQNT